MTRLGTAIWLNCSAVAARGSRRVSASAPMRNSAGSVPTLLPMSACGVWYATATSPGCGCAAAVATVTTLAGAMEVAMAVAATDEAGERGGVRPSPVMSTGETRGATKTDAGSGATTEPVCLAVVRVGCAADSTAVLLPRGTGATGEAGWRAPAASPRVGAPESAEARFASSAQATPAVPMATAVPMPRASARARTRPTEIGRWLVQKSVGSLQPEAVSMKFLHVIRSPPRYFSEPGKFYLPGSPRTIHPGMHLFLVPCSHAHAPIGPPHLSLLGRGSGLTPQPQTTPPARRRVTVGGGGGPTIPMFSGRNS